MPKNKGLFVRISDREKQKLGEIVEDLQQQYPGVEINQSDAVRNAINTYPTKGGKKKGEEEHPKTR